MATLTRRMEVVEERTDSLEDIFAAFMARTDASMARMDASMARTDEAIARMDASMARTNEAIARMDASMARTDERMARTDASMAHTDERIGRLERVVERMERNIERREQEGAREREDAARERKEMNKRWGELANKMGTVVEDIVAPSIRRLAHEVFDCGEQRFFGTRASVNRSDDPSREREFDALYVGARAVLLNQTKSTPRTADAGEFVQFLESGEFALYFPQFKELPIVPAFSSLSIPEDMVRYLTRRGIYAIAMGDEAMQVLNLEAVRNRRNGS